MPTAFDVVSIKPNAANDNRIAIRMAPGGVFTATGITPKLLIGQAFNVRDHQILNAPGWISSERFDVNAKGPEGMPDRVPPEVLRPMLKALLEDRFELKYHTETRELPVYHLTIGKGGSKMKEVAANADERPPGAGPGGPGGGPGGPGGGMNRMMRMGRGQLNATSVPITLLVNQIAQVLGRTVVDKTGLKGLYDFDLEWTPEGHMGGGPGGPGGPPPPDAIPASDTSGPTIFTALQEKLGLKLESAKGPVDVVVIDSVSKPAGN